MIKDKKYYEEKFKTSLMHNKKNWDKSQVDTTHFKPNVNEWNDLTGATINVGSYDESEEMGRLRNALTNPKLDITEKMAIAKNIKEINDAEMKEIVESVQEQEIAKETESQEAKTE